MTALTIEQASELGQRIINTMRPTPPLEDWVEELTGLSHRRAWATFRKLRANTEDGLRIGTFLRLYREDLDHERRARTANTPPPRCEQCSGTGWVEAPPRIAHRATVCRGTPGRHQGENGCWCHAVMPCKCSAGRQADKIVDRIEADRARQDGAT